MKGLLKDEIDTREIGGIVFVQENIILSKFDEIISQNKITTNQGTGEREDKVLRLVEYRVSSEGDIVIVLEKEIYHD